MMQALPRVHNNYNSGQKLRPQPQPIPQKYSRGTTVYKQFQNKYHQGYICDYNSKEGYYKVRLKNEDSVEYDHEQIATMLHKLDKNNLIQALSAVQFDRIQAQYSKTQSTYNEPSIFLVGMVRPLRRSK